MAAVNTALLKKLGWIDYNGRERSWRDYVKPAGFYAEEDDKPKKSFTKRPERKRNPVTSQGR